MSKKTLRETQELFWKLITAPEGAEKGLATLDLGPKDLEEVVRSTERMSALDRMDVYANMYFFRILDVVRDDYPRLAHAVGEERFHNLITDYLLAHPSTHPSLRFIGQHLAEFLKTHELNEQHRWASDLAKLEWARVDVFDAPDHEILTTEELAGIAPEQWADLALELSPALQMHAVEWPVHRVWRAIKDHDAAADDIDADADIAARPTRLRVWRRDGNIVVHKPMTELEHEALRGFGAGHALGPLCEELVHLSDEGAIAVELAQLLQEWIGDQLVVAAHIRTG